MRKLKLNDKKITIKSSEISRNRYFDGIDWLYFETLTKIENKKVQVYHEWKQGNGSVLYAYMMKTDDVVYTR